MVGYVARLKELWDSTQVELQGHYSIQRLEELKQYHDHTSLWRVVAVCMLTPLPCMAVIILIDLLPLEPIANGPKRSPIVWLRTTVAVFNITLCIMEQIHFQVPRLRMQLWLALLTSAAAAGASVAVCYALSLVIGYPLPFTMLVGTVPWFTVLTAMLSIFKFRELRRNRRILIDFVRCAVVGFGQVSLTVMYPLFNYVYKSLSSTNQTFAVLLLPVIKIVAKNWISHALPNAGDSKPEAVVFNVEIFHSLFVSLCMSSTTSNRTVAALMLVDVLQAWLSFRDAIEILEDTHPIAHKLHKFRSSNTSKHPTPSQRARPFGLHDLLDMTSTITQAEPLQACIGRHPYARTRLHPPGAVAPEPAEHHATGPSLHRTPATSVPTILPADLAALTIVERGVLVLRTQKVLFVLEYIVLVEYVEVVMPLMYNIYVVALFYLPNRAFYPFLSHINTVHDLAPSIRSVLVYAALEFVSLVAIAWVVWRRLRLSVVHQLAFVLESQCRNIQSKLVLWMLDMMQTAVVQQGADYSLQFQWLRTREPTH